MTAEAPHGDPPVPPTASWPPPVDVDGDLIGGLDDDRHDAHHATTGAAAQVAAPVPATGPDPLVADGFGGWARRVAQVTRRGGSQLVGCLAVGTVLPAAAIGVTATVTGLAGEVAQPPQVDPATSFVIVVGGAVVLAMVAAVATYVIAASLAATVWLAAAHVAGTPAGLRTVFGVGVRRGLPVWGAMLLAAVAVPVGLSLAVFPGLYAAVVLGMAVPVAVFEGRRVLRRSWRLAHSALWRAASRLLTLYLLVLCYAAVVSAPLTAARRAAATASLAVRYATDGVVGVLQTVVLLPGFAVLLVGMLVTYAEVRGRSETLTAAQLVERGQ